MLEITKPYIKLTLLLTVVSFFISHKNVIGQDNFSVEKIKGSYALVVDLKDNLPPDSLSQNQFKDLLKVYVGNDESKPSILGNYLVENDKVYFQPKFGFRENIGYLAVFKKEKFNFEIPSENKSKTEITAIYPSLDSLPANLLKFYLYFSEPMGEENFYSLIQLFNEQGDTVQNAIVELMPALWSDDKKRLTIWMNPGRIKRELGPNEEQGPPLEVGKTYTLHISKKLRDKSSNELVNSYKKSFYVLPADRIKPDIEKWKIIKPEPGTTEPFQIQLNEAFDAVLLKDAITFLNSADEEIEGELAISDKERICVFKPKMPLKMGKVTIKVKGILEDLAGNNLNRLFDTDIKRDGYRRKEEEFYYLNLRL